MSLNIEEVKKCVERVEIGLLTLQRAKFKEDIESILFLCQLVCSISDSLPPALGKADEDIPDDKEEAYRLGSADTREEDLLWLTKKMMRWEGMMEKSLGDNGDMCLHIKTMCNALKQDMGVKI